MIRQGDTSAKTETADMTDRRRQRHGLLPAAALAILTASPNAALPQKTNWAEGGPRSSAPQHLLVVNFPDSTGKLREAAAERLSRIHALLDKIRKNEAGVATYEEAALAIWQLKWIGPKLKFHGEPLGIDVEYRTLAVEDELKRLFSTALTLPDLKAKIRRRLETLSKSADDAKSKLRKRSGAFKLYEAKRYQEAYEALIETIGPTIAQSHWHAAVNNQRASVVVGWNPILSRYGMQATKQIKERLKRERIQTYTNYTIDSQSLIKAINPVAAQLQKTPQAQLSTGDMADGPSAFRYFVAAWGRLQHKALHALAYQRISKYSADLVGPKFQAETYEYDCNLIVKRLAKIIESDAARASSQEVPGLYDAYLDALPELLTRYSFYGTDGRANLNANITFATALGKLVAKSPELTERVAAYRARTDDLIRWRRRSVAARLQLVKPNFKEIGVNRPLNEISRAVPDLIKRADEKFLATKIMAREFVVAANNRFAVSRLRHRNSFYLPIQNIPFADARENLARALYADAIPAPTLEMRLVLARLTRGDVAKAGGEIVQVGLIGVPTVHLSIKQDDRGLVRLGPVDLEPQERDIKLFDMALRFSLKPIWVADDLYFLAASPADG